MAQKSDEEEYEELTNGVEEIIKLMQSHMGRFPSKDEVVSFIWADDAERDRILEGKLRNGD